MHGWDVGTLTKGETRFYCVVCTVAGAVIGYVVGRR